MASGLAMLLGTVGYWVLMGSHRGWSQNRMPRHATDEVTGLEHVIYDDGFLPGVDLLFAGCMVAVTILFFASFLHRRQRILIP